MNDLTKTAPILTKRLRLRPSNADDISFLEALNSDARVAQWIPSIPHPLPKGLTAERMEYWWANSRKGHNIDFIVCLRDYNKPIGRLIGNFDMPETHLIDNEIGYAFLPEFQGKGYATEALRAYLWWHFECQDRVDAVVNLSQNNLPSKRLAFRMGFQDTSTETLYSHYHKQDLMHDVMTLSRETYLQIKRAGGCVAAETPERELLSVLVAAAALIDADGRVLLAQRPEGKSMAGLWEFPGGKVEKGETPEAALIRELQEELGIDTRNSCLAPIGFASHSYDNFHLLMPLFACRIWDGHPQSKEGQKLAWVRVNKLRNYPMPEADVPLIAQLQDIL